MTTSSRLELADVKVAFEIDPTCQDTKATALIRFAIEFGRSRLVLTHIDVAIEPAVLAKIQRPPLRSMYRIENAYVRYSVRRFVRYSIV